MKNPDTSKEAFKSSLIIAFIYFVFGIFWIIFSDDIASKMANDVKNLTNIQHYKGYFFICLSSIIIFFLTYFKIKQIQSEKQKLAKAQKALNAINRCNHILVRSTNPETLASDICKTIVEIGGYSYAFTTLIENGEMQSVAEYATIEKYNFFKNINKIGSKASPSEFVLKNKGPFICRDIENSNVSGDWKQKVLEIGLHSSVSLPLTDNKEIIGIFNVYSNQKNAFDDDDLRLLIELSDDLGFGIKTLKIEKEKSIINEQLIIFRQAVEQTAESVHLTDARGNIEYANLAFERLTGYSNNEIYGKTSAELLAEKQDRAFYTELRQTLSKNDVFRSVLVNRKKNGEIYYAAWIISPIKNSQGITTHFVAVQTDITELYKTKEELLETNKTLKYTVEELRTTQSQIIQQERLRALGDMASGIVHDFNNTLQPILGNTEILLAHPEYLDDKKRIKDTLELINKLTLEASNTIGRLKEFYRQKEEQERFQPVNLSYTVKEAVILTAAKWRDQSLESGIEINVDVDIPNEAQVNGKESELREIFTNLISNSVDAMPDGGDIKIKGKIFDHNIEIIFTDNGIGMSDEMKRRCMEPFFSTKGVNYNGLGLAIVWGIIQRHDGQILVESKPFNGVKFTISLPLLSNVSPVREAKSKASINKNNLKILLVDDDPTVREILYLYLTGDGHRVTAAENGFEGLDYFQSEEFDIVITDKAMPKMNGDQFASMLKAINPDIPIIMLSGFSAAEDQGAQSKINLALEKPVTLNKLREGIMKCLS